jgi:hypothetical protein
MSPITIVTSRGKTRLVVRGKDGTEVEVTLTKKDALALLQAASAVLTGGR